MSDVIGVYKVRARREKLAEDGNGTAFVLIRKVVKLFNAPTLGEPFALAGKPTLNFETTQQPSVDTISCPVDNSPRPAYW